MRMFSAGKPRLAILACCALLAAPGGARSSIPEDPGPLWVARHVGSTPTSDETPFDMAASPDGSMTFVTGTGTDAAGTENYVTVAYSAATGDMRWVASYDGPGSADDRARAVAVSPDGSTVLVAGQSQSGSNTDAVTVAYSAATGDRLWVARYAVGATDIAVDIVVAPDGSSVLVSGMTQSFDGLYDYLTIAYSGSSGAQLWVARYDAPGDSDDAPNAVAMSPDGSVVVVTGFSAVAGDTDYVTVAYSVATGAQRWVTRYDGPSSSADYATSLAVSPDGSKVFISGYSYTSTSELNANTDYATVAYSASDGEELWATRSSGSGDFNDYAFAIAVSPDGARIFVTGMQFSHASRSHHATISYSAVTGEVLWSAEYRGVAETYDAARALAVSPDGTTVFVTGYSSGTNTGLDYATIAYAAGTGDQLWVAHYAGDAHIDYAVAVVAAPDGSRIFVTGSSANLEGGRAHSDYVTIAYRPTACESGSNETGTISRRVHENLEPRSGIATPYVHGVNCEIIAPNGL